MPTTTTSKGISFKDSLEYNLGNGVDASTQSAIAELSATLNEGIIRGFKTGERARVIGTNLAGHTVEDFTRQFERNAASRTDIKNPVRKITVHNKPGDVLASHQALEASLDLIEKSGYKNCPFVIVEHRDKEHQHFHILLSRVDFDGQVISDKYDYLTLRKWARETEEKYNLTPTAERSARRSLTRAQIEKHVREEIVPSFYQLQAHIDAAIDKSIPEFIEHLESKGASVKFRFNEKTAVGISFSFMGRNFAGRHLGTGFNWQGLQKRGLNYESERDNPAMAAASQRASRKERERTINETPAIVGFKRPTESAEKNRLINETSTAQIKRFAIETSDSAPTESVRELTVIAENAANPRKFAEKIEFDESNFVQKTDFTEKTSNGKTVVVSADKNIRTDENRTFADAANRVEPNGDKFEQAFESSIEKSSNEIGVKSESDFRENAGTDNAADSLQKQENVFFNFSERKSNIIADEIAAPADDKLPERTDRQRAGHYRSGQMGNTTDDRCARVDIDSRDNSDALLVDFLHDDNLVDNNDSVINNISSFVDSRTDLPPVHVNSIVSPPSGGVFPDVSAFNKQTRNPRTEKSISSSSNESGHADRNNQSTSKIESFVDYTAEEEFTGKKKRGEKIRSTDFKLNEQKIEIVSRPTVATAPELEGISDEAERPTSGFDISYADVLRLAIETDLINKKLYEWHEQQSDNGQMRYQIMPRGEQFKSLLEFTLTPQENGFTQNLTLRGNISSASPSVCDSLVIEQPDFVKSRNVIGQDVFSPVVESLLTTKTSIDLATILVKANDLNNQKSWNECEEESRRWLARNFSEAEVNGAEDARSTALLNDFEKGALVIDDEDGEIKVKREEVQQEIETERVMEEFEL